MTQCKRVSTLTTLHVLRFQGEGLIAQRQLRQTELQFV
jgi:hypothetical protein